jgi:hypothetical protein
VKGGGRAPPSPSPCWAKFTIMMEFTPLSVYNLVVQEVVHFDPGHPEDCAIQLYNVSQEMMGIWAARYTIVTRVLTKIKEQGQFHDILYFLLL